MRSVIETIRKRALKNIGEDVVIEDLAADPDTVVRLLNKAIATELVCVLRYHNATTACKGTHSDPERRLG